MTGDNPQNVGTAGSTADFKNYYYPGVPYTQEHFHYPHCAINNYNDAVQVCYKTKHQYYIRGGVESRLIIFGVGRAFWNSHVPPNPKF